VTTLSDTIKPPPPIPPRVDDGAIYANGEEVTEALFDWLHEYAPLYWYDEQRLWIVSSWTDIRDVARVPNTYVSSRGNHFFPKDDRGERRYEGAIRAGLDPRIAAQTIIEMDPPQHTDYRKLVHRSLSVGLDRLEQELRMLIRDCLKPLRDGEDYNLVEQLAVPVPLWTIAILLGVPIEDAEMYRRWSDDIAAQNAPGGSPPLKTLQEMFDYFENLLHERKANPQGDLVSIIASGLGDGRFGDAELLHLCGFVLNAGNETTRNLISGGVRALLENQDQWDVMRERRDIVPNAVEEMLRYVSPIRYFGRVAAHDTELAGQPIAAGDAMFLYYAAANRDPKVYADPHVFDVTRDFSAHPHLAFAHGVHFCVGARLARLEAQLVFDELLDACPRLERAGEIRTEPNLMINVTTDLPVRAVRS